METLFSSSFEWAKGLDHLEVVTEDYRTSLRVRYIPDSSGSTNVTSPIHIPERRQVTLSYSVFLEPGWEFVRGGKLPGLCGGSPAAGGIGGNGDDGFSTRFMWRTGGSLVVYAYHPDRPGQWGEDFPTTAELSAGQWIELTQQVTMNTPGESDGSVRVWVDQEMVLDQGGFRWSIDGSFAIDKMCFSTFFGGSDSSWSPSDTVFARFSDFTTY